VVRHHYLERGPAGSSRGTPRELRLISVGYKLGSQVPRIQRRGMGLRIRRSRYQLRKHLYCAIGNTNDHQKSASESPIAGSKE